MKLTFGHLRHVTRSRVVITTVMQVLTATQKDASRSHSPSRDFSRRGLTFPWKPFQLFSRASWHVYIFWLSRRRQSSPGFSFRSFRTSPKIAVSISSIGCFSFLIILDVIFLNPVEKFVKKSFCRRKSWRGTVDFYRGDIRRCFLVCRSSWFLTLS